MFGSQQLNEDTKSESRPSGKDGSGRADLGDTGCYDVGLRQKRSTAAAHWFQAPEGWGFEVRCQQQYRQIELDHARTG